MGAELWQYFVPFQSDVAAAMQALQQREFAAGRYHSRRASDPSLPPPQAIDDLRENYLSEEGSRSILDMMGVADDAGDVGTPAEIADMIAEMPEGLRGAFGGGMPAFCTVVRMSDADLQRFFGTTRPTREQVEANSDFHDDIQRGCGIYIVVHRDGRPDELFFAGYSFD